MTSPSHNLPEQKLRTLREERGLTVRDVARLSEGAFTASQVTNLEQGVSSWKKARIETLEGLARAFSMSVQDLLAFVDNRRPVLELECLEDFFKPIPTYHLTYTTASSGKGVLQKVADEETLLPDSHYLYDLYELYQNSEREPHLRLLVRKQSKPVKAGHLIVCSCKEWGFTVAKVRVIKGKEFVLDDQLFGRSDIFKEKEFEVLGIVKAETRLLDEPE